MAIHFNQTTSGFKLKNRLKIKQWINQVIENHNFKTGKICFTFCNDDELLSINKQFLSHDTLTDIITFDYCEKNYVHSEIYISVERVLENSKKENELFENEINRVIIHGILHLCGFKDKTSNEKSIMRKKENEMLDLLKIMKQ